MVALPNTWVPAVETNLVEPCSATGINRHKEDSASNYHLFYHCRDSDVLIAFSVNDIDYFQRRQLRNLNKRQTKYFPVCMKSYKLFYQVAREIYIRQSTHTTQ